MNIYDYDYIGFASGIYYNKMDKDVIGLFRKLDLQNKKVFFVYTCGCKYRNFTKQLEKECKEKSLKCVGSFGCRGYDTYKIFGKLGGISKKHPNSKDFKKARLFIKQILEGNNIND